MARGEYCAAHNRYFGNIIPCEECERERRQRELESMELLSWDELEKRWRAAHNTAGK